MSLRYLSAVGRYTTERIAIAQQMEIVRCLLLALDTEDPTWVVTWLMQDLTDTERKTLLALTARLASTPPAPVAPVPAG